MSRRRRRRSRGFERAKLLRGREPAPGREAAGDGLDRSDRDGLAMLADAWLADLGSRGYSERTEETRRRALVLFVRWCQDRALSRPREITRAMLESYRRHLSRLRKSDGAPLAPGTQAGRLAAVRGLFKWLMKEGHLDADPAAHLEMPRQSRRLPADCPSVEEVESLLAAPDTGDPLGVRDRAILEVLYGCGLRRTECASLALDDLHLHRSVLVVRKGKGGHDRVVPLAGRTVEWLQRYLDDVRPRLVVDASEPALFLTGYGRGFSPGSLGNMVARLVRSTWKRPGGCHLLRHACATHMLEAGADVRVIQQLLGHAKLETTQVYTEVSIRLLRDVHAKTHPSALENPQGGGSVEP